MSSNISFHTRRKLLVQSRQIKELSRRFGEGGGGGSFDAEETEAEPRSSISRRHRRALVMGSAAVTRLPSGRRKSLLIMRVTRDADPVLAAGELRLRLGGGGTCTSAAAQRRRRPEVRSPPGVALYPGTPGLACLCMSPPAPGQDETVTEASGTRRPPCRIKQAMSEGAGDRKPHSDQERKR